jgi:hypothetical protein
MINKFNEIADLAGVARIVPPTVSGEHNSVFGLSGQEEVLAQSEIDARAKSDGNDQYEEMVDNALAFGEPY